MGLTLLFLEFLINTQANLNLAIYHSFKGSFPQVYQVTNIQWVLFYPCLYAFAAWQAYNKAVEINNSLNNELYKEGNETNRRTRLNGVFAGFAMGGTLGVIYNGSIGYVFSGILGGFLGAVIGSVIEGMITKKYIYKEAK